MGSGSELSEPVVDNLLRFGVYASSYFSEYSKIPLYNVVSNLLQGQRNRTYNLTRDLADAMAATGSKTSPVVGLTLLEEYFVVAPHDNCASTGKTFQVAAAVITLVFIVARLVLRKWVIRCGISRADWAMFSGWIVTILYLGSMFLNIVNNNACHHVYDISFTQLRGTVTYTLAMEVLYCVASCAVKLAFLMFFWDLTHEKLWRRMIIFIAVICMLVDGVAMISVVFQCNPLDSGNQNAAANTKCLEKEKLLKAMGTANVVTDFLVLLIGIPIAWKVRMKVIEKIIAGVLFCLGALVCGAAIARVSTNQTFISNPDATYKQGTSGFWGAVELSLAIVISCLAALGGFFSRNQINAYGADVDGSRPPHEWQAPGGGRGDVEMVGKQRMRSMDSDGINEAMRPNIQRPQGKLEGRYYMKKDGWSDGDFEVGFAK